MMKSNDTFAFKIFRLLLLEKFKFYYFLFRFQDTYFSLLRQIIFLYINIDKERNYYNIEKSF